MGKKICPNLLSLTWKKMTPNHNDQLGSNNYNQAFVTLLWRNFSLQQKPASVFWSLTSQTDGLMFS